MPSQDRLAEMLLTNVVHDLRQPLGTIETSAYLLNRMLRQGENPLCQHLDVIERQVDLAARILNDAAAELLRLHAQRAEAESRDFTKSQTAAVT